ncbi:hypothetical protein JTB14_032040 [Gonioctena quinquepunctata]|nr:hypothetical protein JTB14_032040 [Gonioctena quinquepunctata]
MVNGWHPGLVVHNRETSPLSLGEVGSRGYRQIPEGWRILDDEPVSDHALIAYELAGNQSQRRVYTTDWDAFRENLDWRIQSSVDDDSAETCSRLMKEAYRSSGTRETLSRKPYWWNNDIADKCKTCTQLRRRTSRMLDGGTYERRKGSAQERI